MQPRWLPTLRAGIGVTLILAALVVLVAARPWEWPDLVMVACWAGLGSFLVWASRRERSGTRLTKEEIVLTSGRQVDRLTRQDILDLRHDQPEPHAWRIEAVLADGRRVILLGVPPGELERLRRWHLGPTRGRR